MSMPVGTKLGFINLIPLYYERRSSDDVWGDFAPEERQGFYFSGDFHKKLIELFMEIETVFGKPKGIISAGAWVDKPGMHKEARAFDLDGIVWEDWKWRATDTSNTDQIKKYLVIQAICMKHFGTVLGYLYNTAHADHIHLDDATEPGFKYNSRSVVRFIQLACNVFSNPLLLTLDGSWGPKTADSMRGFLGLPFKKYPKDVQYFAFLDMVIGKYRKEEKKEPIGHELLSNDRLFMDIRNKIDVLEQRLKNG